MLNNLHQYDSVITGEPIVPVRHRGLHQLEAGPLAVRHPVQVQPSGSELKRPVGHVNPEHLCERRVGDELAQQRTLPAPEIDNARGGLGAQRGNDRGDAQLSHRRHPARLPALVRGVFAHARPASVLVTTPNAEHNVRFPFLPAGAMRHRDHRFEWTRGQFRDWADSTAASHGYTVRYQPVGENDLEVGPPTQMAVFRRAG